MAIARVNSWTPSAKVHDTEVSQEFANVTAGSLLVAVSFVGAGNEAQSIADTNGNTWVEVDHQYHTNLDNGAWIWYAKNANAGLTSITNSSASAIDRQLVIMEYSGVDATSPVDGTPVKNDANGSTSQPDPGAITTTGDAVLIGVAIMYPNANPTAATNYTKQYDSAPSGFQNLEIEDWIATGAQVNNHPLWATNEDYWQAFGFAFKAATVAAPATPTQPWQQHGGMIMVTM